MFKIISRDGCPYCEKAIELIINKGLEFKEIKINDVTERNNFYDSLGLEDKNRSVPQIWKINDNEEEYIGGYTQLRSYFRNN